MEEIPRFSKEWTKESWKHEERVFAEFLKREFSHGGRYIILHDGPIQGGTGICGRPETWKED